MSKKVLLGCYEIPGYGGANTSSYELFEKMQNDGLDISYVNLLEEQDVDFYRYIYGENIGNPKNLKDVYNCILKGRLFNSHHELKSLIADISPDILIGKGFIAALLLKKAAKEKKLIFYTAACEQVYGYINNGIVKNAIDLYNLTEKHKNRITIFNMREKEAVELSDYIITHSEQTKYFLEKIFPDYIGKICPKAIEALTWIYDNVSNYSNLKRNFKDRDIDVLFIASSWNRPEKNYKLVKRIISHCRDLKIHVVGEVNEKKIDSKYHGLVTERDDLFTLLGRTKTVVSPSLYDPAPGILYEASTMGCNIIASKNCGNWQICNEKLLVEPFNLSCIIKKIYCSLNEKYDDNMDYSSKSNDYKNLIDTITLF